MQQDLRHLPLASGAALSLVPLLGRLQLSWEYVVLAAAMHPNDPSMVYVLIQRNPNSQPPDPTPYVVYRVDSSDGSCHGGQYLSELGRAFQRFAERLIPLLQLDHTPAPPRPSGRRINAEAARRVSLSQAGRHSGWDGEDEFVYQDGALVDVTMEGDSLTPDQSNEGYRLGLGSDEQPAYTAQSEFYADNTQSGEGL